MHTGVHGRDRQGALELQQGSIYLYSIRAPHVFLEQLPSGQADVPSCDCGHLLTPGYSFLPIIFCATIFKVLKYRFINNRGKRDVSDNLITILLNLNILLVVGYVGRDVETDTF